MEVIWQQTVMDCCHSCTFTYALHELQTHDVNESNMSWYLYSLIFKR